MIGLIVTRGLDDPGNNEVFRVQCEAGSSCARSEKCFRLTIFCVCLFVCLFGLFLLFGLFV